MAAYNSSGIELFHKIFPSLSDMQCRCVYYYSRGYTATQVSEFIGITPQNVNKYLHASAEKMGGVGLQALRMTVSMEIDMLILSKIISL